MDKVKISLWLEQKLRAARVSESVLDKFEVDKSKSKFEEEFTEVNIESPWDGAKESRDYWRRKQMEQIKVDYNKAIARYKKYEEWLKTDKATPIKIKEYENEYNKLVNEIDDLLNKMEKCDTEFTATIIQNGFKD